MRVAMRRMYRTTMWGLIAGSALALPGCATQRPETRVTRFHLQQPIAPGQVAIEGRTPAMTGSLEFAAYSGAVGRELARLGFTLAPGIAASELVAVVDVTRTTREGLPQQSPLSIGLGGGGFSGGRRGGGVGLGGGISFPIGKARSRYVTVTELAVQLKRRSDGTVIWEGRAQQAARADAAGADPAMASATIAAALFQGFPGDSGRTVTVK